MSLLLLARLTASIVMLKLNCFNILSIGVFDCYGFFETKSHLFAFILKINLAQGRCHYSGKKQRGFGGSVDTVTLLCVCNCLPSRLSWQHPYHFFIDISHINLAVKAIFFSFHGKHKDSTNCLHLPKQTSKLPRLNFVIV